MVLNPLQVILKVNEYVFMRKKVQITAEKCDDEKFSQNDNFLPIF